MSSNYRIPSYHELEWNLKHPILQWRDKIYVSVEPVWYEDKLMADLNRSKVSRPTRAFDWNSCSDLRSKHRQRSEKATNSTWNFERVNRCQSLRLKILVRVQWHWDEYQMQCEDIGGFLIGLIFFWHRGRKHTQTPRSRCVW